ncbi:MAG: hypothetical protein Q9188_007659, partial [Gyalolechia gomerana]
MVPSPKVAQEPYPYDSDSSCDPIYPAPSTARLTALYAKKQQPAQKENHRPPPLHDVPFRTVNWAPPSPSTSSANLGHLRKRAPNLSPD